MPILDAGRSPCDSPGFSLGYPLPEALQLHVSLGDALSSEASGHGFSLRLLGFLATGDRVLVTGSHGTHLFAQDYKQTACQFLIALMHALAQELVAASIS